jgi:hypothetical protein
MKAVVLMSNSSCLTMVLTLKEDVVMPPLFECFYETYDNLAELQNRLETEKRTNTMYVSNDLITNSMTLKNANIPNYGIMQIMWTLFRFC